MNKVTKLDAARRQIDAAITLHFDGHDPLVVHTLAMAGLQIVHDLCRQQGSQDFRDLMAMIESEISPKFWKEFRSIANFLKHADKDPDSELNDMDGTVNDLILVIAVQYYTDLGCSPTPEMATISAFVRMLQSEQLSYRVGDRDVLMAFCAMDRSSQLRMGRESLESLRASVARGGSELTTR